ncbi:terminase small subunit [Edwardsiella phage PEi21]|uniref:Phage terminase, small subunit n=1 Tax=Edwardsiella phage PEi21 TaxID=1325372 RepID=N0DP38_9CAUD|nr:terminase small subunit [Edwardsiella phage PEi21]BAN16811.1 phage terminase, small subunit [Edwardsiella phage PEi21]
MTRGLTDKQSKFAMLYVENGGNAAQAYRDAGYGTGGNEKTTWRRAKDVYDNGKVQAEIERLRKRAQKRAERKHDVTLDTLLLELEEARTVALSGEKPQAAAAVSATMGKAKLVGLDKQVLEVTGELSVRRTLDDFYGDA